MDYIFLECLLVLKVKGGGSRETVDCLGHLEISFVGELWGGGANCPISVEGNIRKCSKEDCSI